MKQTDNARSLQRLVSLRLSVSDLEFIGHELRTAAHCGAEDEAFLRLADLIAETVCRHKAKANEKLSDGGEDK